jgi:hypothetical protein
VAISQNLKKNDMTDTQEIFFNQLFILAGKAVIGCMIIPILIAFIKKNCFNKPIKIFFIFCLLSIFVALFLQAFIWFVDNYTVFARPYLNKWNIHDTLFMGIFAYINHFALLGWYYVVSTKSEKLRQGIKWLSIFLFVTTLTNYLFIEGYNVYSSFNATASAVFCFVLPMIHLWFVFNTDSVVPISKNPYFWIDLGLVVPNLIGLFLHFAGSKIYGDDFILYVKISLGKYVFVVISQIFFAIAFYRARYTQFLPEKW